MEARTDSLQGQRHWAKYRIEIGIRTRDFPHDTGPAATLPPTEPPMIELRKVLRCRTVACRVRSERKHKSGESLSTIHRL